ncbi:MAG: class II aldolase/adducin family protein [Peptococcaceae bacterium]|jgi:L-fuculose-phosphate aldolase|nr:class II aldolase/adducin family protein [Peptococcaceae bacterium]
MLRESILAVGREIVHSGLVVGTWGNVSAWDPEKQGYWITPSGMDYATLAEEDLVLLDLDHQVLDGRRKPSTEHLLHQEIYRQRGDVKGIVHIHSAYATAHAVARTPLPGIIGDLIQSAGAPILVAAYENPGSIELALAAAAALGERNAVLLANHGLVGVGATAEGALQVCQVVERSAQIHILSQSLGGPILLDEEQIQTIRQGYREHYGQRQEPSA